MLKVGDRVRVRSLAFGGVTGTLVGETRRFGQFRWVLEPDNPGKSRYTIEVSPTSVRGIDLPDRLGPGDHVLVLAGALSGHTGTLVRPTRFLWQQAWLVEWDAKRLGRSRVTTHVLRLCEEPVES